MIIARKASINLNFVRFVGAACGMTGFFLLGVGGYTNSVIGTTLTGIGAVLLAAGAR